MPKVVIYTGANCSYCVAAKRYLREVKRVPFEEIDLTGQIEARRELAQRSGQMTIPQIFIGAVHVGGYTDLRALDARGGLDPLLADPPSDP